MASCTRLIRTTILPALAGLLVFLYLPLARADYVPFPGRIPVTVVGVESPRDVVVSYETWPGFRRDTVVRLPGVVVPEDTPGSPPCERELAARALAFTRGFIDDASRVWIQDMRMETSADPVGYSDVLTDHGSLKAALTAAGLARSETHASGGGWCHEQAAQ